MVPGYSTKFCNLKVVSFNSFTELAGKIIITNTAVKVKFADFKIPCSAELAGQIAITNTAVKAKTADSKMPCSTELGGKIVITNTV
jgi:hypothetical protein